MVVEIRIYKRFDTDLISLCASGYSVSTMIRDAVIAYANGSPVHYYIDEPVTFDMNDTKNVHTRFIVPDSDVKTCYMLKNIKHGYRNTFCKMILRNALVQQNLSGFFADEALSMLQNENMKGRNLYSFQNVIPCSTVRVKTRQIEVLGKTIDVEQQEKKKRGRKKKVSSPAIQPNMTAMQYGNPYANMMPAMYGFPPQGMQMAPMTGYPQMGYYGMPQGDMTAYQTAPQTNVQPNEPQTARPIQQDMSSVTVTEPEQREQPAYTQPPVSVQAAQEQSAIQEDAPVVSENPDGIQVAEDKSLLDIFDAL